MIIFNVVMSLLCISSILCIYRAIKGPSVVDRIMAMNTLSAVIIGMAILLGIFKDGLFIDVAIPIALISFISTLVICKYLEG